MELNETLTPESENIKKKTMESCLLDEIKLVKSEVVESSQQFKEFFERIYVGTENIKFNISTGNTLKIGAHSVKPLIEIKTLANEMFSNVRNNEVKMLYKRVDFEPFENHIIELRKQSNESRHIINLLGLMIEATAKLIDPKNQLITNGNSNESNASSHSVASSDPSISEFSLFDNSTTNAATSSPLATPEKLKKL